MELIFSILFFLLGVTVLFLSFNLLKFRELFQIRKEFYDTQLLFLSRRVDNANEMIAKLHRKIYQNSENGENYDKETNSM